MENQNICVASERSNEIDEQTKLYSRGIENCPMPNTNNFAYTRNNATQDQRTVSIKRISYLFIYFSVRFLRFREEKNLPPHDGHEHVDECSAYRFVRILNIVVESVVFFGCALLLYAPFLLL